MVNKTGDSTMTTSAKSDKIIKIVIGLLSFSSYGVAFALAIYMMYAQSCSFITDTATMPISVLGSVLVTFFALVFVFKSSYSAARGAKYAIRIGRIATINTKSLFFPFGISDHILCIALVKTLLAVRFFCERVDTALRTQISFCEAASSFPVSFLISGATFVAIRMWGSSGRLAAGYTEPGIFSGLSFSSATVFLALFTAIAIGWGNLVSTFASSHRFTSLMSDQVWDCG